MTRRGAAYIRWGKNFRVALVDTRKTLIQVAGQEVLSADNVGVKLSVVLTTQTNPTAYDIEFLSANFRMRWNLTDDGSMWIKAPNSINEVGCIHIAQGLEVDYIGVIIGDDLDVDNEGHVTTFVTNRRLKIGPCGDGRTSQRLTQSERETA